MKIAVTIFPIYDLARRIAGPDADVVLLVPVGRSEVGFAPGGHEADAVTGAKLGIFVGLGLDDWMQELLDHAAPQARRLAVGARVPTLPVRQSPIGQTGAPDAATDKTPPLEAKPDPYVWLDPSRAALMAKAMAEEMARADASHAAGYRQRSAELMLDLDGLDREIESRVESWGARSFVPPRPAFGYFAERYHLQIPAAVEGSAGVPVSVLDALGGGEETGTYDRLIRFDTDALERVLKPKAAPSSVRSPPTDGG